MAWKNNELGRDCNTAEQKVLSTTDIIREDL